MYDGVKMMEVSQSSDVCMSDELVRKWSEKMNACLATRDESVEEHKQGAKEYALT